MRFFLFRKELEKVFEVQRATSMMLIIKMMIVALHTHIFCACAAVRQTGEEKGAFLERLDEVDEVENDLLLIGGDINGHIGACRREFEEMGAYGYGERNTDEEKVLQFCQEGNV